MGRRHIDRCHKVNHLSRGRKFPSDSPCQLVESVKPIPVVTVWMLTKAFALEVAEFGIRVNAIGPGFIETPMTARMASMDESKQMMMAMTPMGRLGVVEEIASTALFLSSDESSYFSGQILHPAGGMFTS